ncbi:MAG: hypothetical protein LBG81_09115 [Coriobacteriaceae bacterium]|jgi:hypothetical protein|nr:hypothetical protein [Coriobacteriaceae bacterium]
MIKAYPIAPAEERTQDRYFYHEFLTYGKYQFPYVEKQPVNLDDLKLIRFSDTAPNEKRRGCHGAFLRVRRLLR